MKNILLTFIFLLTANYWLKAQQTTIRVLDANDGQPIPSAHVCTESADKSEKGFQITDANGFVKILLNSKVEVAISLMGYQTLIDTLEPGKSYTFKIKPTTEEISEVVVTGQIKPETKDKSIYNVQVLNSLQIQNKAANNLGELLNNELNISIGNNGVLGTSVQMQGLSGEHIKILVDGVPVIGRQDGGIDLGQLNLQNVDHVEIVEGPMSVVYGSNALAGAINIITKKNTRTHYNTNFSTYYETVGVYNINGGFTANLKNHHIGITGGRNFFDGYSYSELGYRSFNFNPKEQYTTALDYGYSTNKLQITLKQDFFQEKLFSYDSAYYADTVYIAPTLYAFPMADDIRYKTLRANTKTDLQYKLTDNSAISFMAAYSYYSRSKNTYHKNLYYLTTDLSQDSSRHDTTVFNDIMSRASYTRQIKKIDLQAGYDLSIETGTGKRIVGTPRIDDYAAFLSLQYKPLSILSFQGGTRFIYNTKFNAPVVYSINTKWDPSANLTLRASYGTGFRSPSLKEMYLNFVDVNHEVKGNPDLEAEYSSNFNVSMDFNTEKEENKNKFSLKLYHNRINNKIDFLYDSINPAKADYINIDGLFKTIGGQLEYSYNLHPRFDFKTGINFYGRSKIADLNEYTYTPDFTASINYHNLKYLFRLNVFYKYNGMQSQFYPKEKDGKKIIEERYISAYNMLDISLNRPFYGNKLTVSAGVKNLLNVKTVDGTGGPSGPHGGSGDSSSIAWGRTFFIKLNLDLNKF